MKLQKKRPENPGDPITSFCIYLEHQGRSPKTISVYSCSVRLFFRRFDNLNIENLKAYRSWLISTYQFNTVNSRIQSMNRYLEFLYSCQQLPPELVTESRRADSHLPASEDRALPAVETEISESFKTDPALKDCMDGIYRMCLVKEQKRNYLDSVISQRDYERFKRRLRKDGNMYWYFVIRFLGATGARISELLQIKMEDLKAGYLDLYSKGGKIRRLFFPRALCDEAIPYFSEKGIRSGFIFLNRRGSLITSRGIELQLKQFARRYRIDPDTVYPHSFRHRFAKNFLKRFNDISLLADLMGHDSIETTRIYLTRSSQEQKALIDRVVTW